MTLVWFAIVDYDEASLPFADGEPVYAVDARSVSFDEEAGPHVGYVRVPPAPFAVGGHLLALVGVEQTPYAILETQDDGLVSIKRVDQAVRR